MLSEEEKKLLKIFKAQVAKEETEYFTVNAYTQLLYDSHKTALNLINRLQKENEYWKNGFERELEANRENTCELLKQDLMIKEKDKQIHLMAEYIDEIDVSEVICGEKIICDENCKDCIKQYFETKAKKGE